MNFGYNCLIVFKIFSGLCSTISENDEPYLAAMKAIEMYKNGSIDDAIALFNTFATKYSKFPTYYMECLRFLMKVGDFRAIVGFVKNNDLKDQQSLDMLDKALGYLVVIQSNNIEKIAKLIQNSPDSIQINLAVVELCFKNGDINKAKNYIDHALKLDNIRSNENYRRLLDFDCRYLFDIRAYEHGLECLNSLVEIDSKTYQRLYQMYSNIIREYENVKNNESSSKLNALGRIYNSTLAAKQQDSYFVPSIFNSIYFDVLDYLVNTGCDVGYSDTQSYSARLYSIDKSAKTVINYIKALVIGNNLGLATEILAKHTQELTKRVINYLTALIAQKKAVEEEKENQRQKEMQERQKRKQMEEQEREKRRKYNEENMYSKNATHYAGSDFLGYYKMLGVKKDTSLADIKKAHRKCIRDINKKYAKVNLTSYPKNQSPKDADVKKLNIAFQVLTDPDQKKAYDFGIHPDQAQQMRHQSQHQQHDRFHQGSMFGEDQDIAEIFSKLFGSSGRGQGSRFVYTSF